MNTQTIKNQTMPRKVIIKLNTPKGNSLYLLGVARKYCRMLGLNTIQIHREMTQSDYENLIKTFEKYFSEYVTLQR
jgi:hypothetical protein